MKRKSLIALWSIAAFAFISRGLLASIAWFENGRSNVDVDIGGAVVEDYFHCGDGSSADPYVITRPIHYYHLVELFQRVTSLSPTSDFGTDYLYFQVGYDIDEDGDLEVYNYDDQGIYQGTSDTPSYSNTLNMAYYSATNALMPIGTNEVPFIGSFDGKADEGIAIANLNIHCAERVYIGGSPVDRAASDIGIFGYVADKDTGNTPTVIKNAKFNGLTIDLSDVSSVVGASQTGISHIEAHGGQAFVGLVAGHVHAYTNYSSTGPTNAAPLYNVYVSNASVVGGAGVHCNYGYIGKVDTINGNNAATVMGEVDALNTGSGSGNRFGGSIDMYSLYNRLRRVYNGPAVDNGSYDSITYDYDNGSLTEGGKVENLSNHFSNYHADDFSYTFNKHSSGNQNYYYLYGNLDSAAGGTRTSTTHYYQSTSVSADGFKLSQDKRTCYFKSGNYYLKVPQLTRTSAVTITASNIADYRTTNFSEKTLFDVTTSGSYYLFHIKQTINAKEYFIQLGLTTSSVQLTLSQTLQTTNNYARLSENSSGYWSAAKNPTYYFIMNGSSVWNVSRSPSSSTAVNDTMSTQTSYLKINGDFSLSTTTNLSDAGVWVFDGSKIYSRLLLDDKYYLFYLNGTSSGLSVSRFATSASATSWSTGWSNNNQLALSFVDSSKTYYLSLSDGTLISTSSVTTTRLNAGTVSGSAYLYVNTQDGGSESFPSSSFPATYIPLSVSSSSIYTTAQYNTGYIMSGKSYTHNTPTELSRYEAGDVRVSRYGMENIQSSLGQTTYDNTKLFAITATNNSNYALITDDHNKNSTVPSEIAGITARKSAASLYRYNDWTEDDIQSTGAREAMGNVFEDDSSSIYGLHFMDATISQNNIVHIPNAVINGDTYQNGHDMLGNSIDFHVKQKGYIVFFAGTYFNVDRTDENDCFFSLHKVNRGSNGQITSAPTISKIYKDAAGTFHPDPASTTGMTEVFDTAVLTAPSTTYFKNNAVYYFEIPVEAGEYALGSVSGKNGAYLMYLDISASGSQTTQNQEHMIDDAPLFTQIDFQTDNFVVNSCFNVAYVIPAGATKENFRITISCGTVTREGHDYVCYELVIENTTGNDFFINCLLMDNDDDPRNDYYVLYAIKYNDGTRTEYTASNSYTGTSGATSMTPTYSQSNG